MHRGVHRFRDSEIGDHRDPVRQQHIVGLDVPMDDVVRVRVGQRTGDLSQNPDRLRHGHRRRSSQTDSQGLAFDERHGEVRHTPVLAGGEQRDDIGVLQPRGDRDFPPESID